MPSINITLVDLFLIGASASASASAALIVYDRSRSPRSRIYASSTRFTFVLLYLSVFWFSFHTIYTATVATECSCGADIQ
ncbi:hypothetical protein CRYUN_Cryun21dG0128100 [Craigia yunnanensis]